MTITSRRRRDQLALRRLRTAAVAVHVEMLEPRRLLAGDGLVAEYFDNLDFTGLAVTRVDPRVDFDWDTNAPIPGEVAADTFSVRWRGGIEVLHDELYTFETRSDDGVRLRIDGQTVIDAWNDHAPRLDSGTIQLEAGRRYAIELDYYENRGLAVAELYWSSASQPREIVPQSALYTSLLPEGQVPFTGDSQPWAVPATGATRIHFADYDLGGDGVAWNDREPANRTGDNRHRPDPGGPDVFGTGSGRGVGWFDRGDWTEYTVDLAQAGTYDLTLRGTVPYDANFRVGDQTRGDTLGTFTFANTGGWGNWREQTFPIQLPAGETVLRFERVGGSGFNLNWFKLARTGDLPGYAGTFQLGTNQLVVGEGDGQVRVPVTRTGGTAGVVEIEYTTVDNTALAGEDYVATAGRVAFANGQEIAYIDVPIVDDAVDESAEAFGISLDSLVVGNGDLAAPRTAVVTVEDDDGTGGSDLPAFGVGRFEVEHGELTNFDVNAIIFASNGEIGRISKPSGTVATSEFTFTGPTALYDLDLAYFDETDGEGLFRVLVDGAEVGRVIANQNLGSNAAAQSAYTSIVFRDVTIPSGSRVTVEVTADIGELGRTDYLDIDPNIPLDGKWALEEVCAGLVKPTGIEFADDGAMFVFQQDGRVYVNDGPGTPLRGQAFLDFRDRVNGTRDRGLLGFALDPSFPQQPYAYLSYTYDPPQTQGRTGLAGPDGKGNRVARITRVTATAASGFKQIDPNSEVVLVGKNSTWANISHPDKNSTSDLSLPPSGQNPDGTWVDDVIPADSESHTIGAIAFGPDGALYAASGDGTSYGAVDPRTVRVQDLDSLSGKILRVDPATGRGLADNPFFTGDADDDRSKVFALGLRNPYRLTIDQTDGRVLVGDVGWTRWEEINVARGGDNFGWPFYEGGANGELVQTPGYKDLPEAADFYADGPAVTPALYARSHQAGASAIIAGDLATSGVYPAQYDGSLFFNDIGFNNLQVLLFNDDGSVNRAETLIDDIGFVVEMTVGPQGDLYLTNLADGTIDRVTYG